MIKINLLPKKKCSKCGRLRAKSDFSGRSLQCRACLSVYGRARHLQLGTVEKIKNKYHSDPEFRARRLAQNRRWAEQNKDRCAELSREYYGRNRERVLELRRQRNKENPDKANKAIARWNSLAKSASGGLFQADRPEYLARARFYGGFCAYCQEKPYETFDHAIPLTRGGGNWPANIYPTCRRCNCSKGAKKLYAEWVPPAAHERFFRLRVPTKP